MNSTTYRNILRVLEKWPLDLSKSGRDAGEFLRAQVGTYFIINKGRDVDECAWEEIALRLNRISSDYYKKTFGVSRIATSTGLSESQCHDAISNDGLDLMKQENDSMTKSFLKKFKPESQERQEANK